MVDSTATYDRGMDAPKVSIMNGERAAVDRAPRSTVQGFDAVERSGPEHVSALLKMGAAKQDAGNYSEAEDLFGRALELGERVLGPENPALVATLMSLAGSRILCGNPESAEPLVIRALSITENARGEYDPELGILVSDLARLCLKQSAHAVAEPLLLRLLAMKRSKGDDHPEVGTVLASLAAARQALGRHESAEQLWRRVLEIRERTLAPNHVGLATALERLAESCSARGKVGEALGLLQRALTIRELTLGADNPTLRVSRDRIADLQLQASEDFLDPSMYEAPVPAPEKYRLLAADHSAQSVSKPVREKSAAKVRIEKPVAEPRKTTATASVIDLAPVIEPRKATAGASIVEAAPEKEEIKPALHPVADYTVGYDNPVDVRPVPDSDIDDPTQDSFDAPQLVDYRDVILSIRQELEEDEDAPPTAVDRARVVLGTMAAGLKRRQKEIAVVAGAVALVAGLTTVSQALIKSQRAADGAQTATPVPTQSPTTAPSAAAAGAQPLALVNDRAKAPAVASAEATPVATSTKTRAVEQRTPAKKPVERKAIAIPAMSSAVMAGFDSLVRAHTSTPRLISEPSAVVLPPANGEAAAIFSPARESLSAPPQRARLIGRLPAPHYPEQLIDVPGDVRVRFDVDASGRPVMSSLAVLATSNEFFSAAVFKVIPGLRFVPAHSGGVDSKPIADVVQLGFAFRPTK